MSELRGHLRFLIPKTLTLNLRETNSVQMSLKRMTFQVLIGVEPVTLKYCLSQRRPSP